MCSVFAGCILSCHKCVHVSTILIAVLRAFGSELINFKSSAKAYMLTVGQSVFKVLRRSSMHSAKSRGPSTDPCGTPLDVEQGEEKDPSKVVRWVLPVRYCCSQKIIVGLILKWERIKTSFWWETVSNAFEKSK